MLKNKKKLMVLIALAATIYNGYLHTTVVKAEGSRELVNTYNQSTNQYVSNGGYRPFLWASDATTAGITRRTTFNVYAQQGETLNFGSSVAQNGSILVKKPGATSWTSYTVSSSGTKAGFIENVAEEKIGPNSGGYVPITLNVGATEAGIWQFQFVGPTGVTGNPTFQKGSSEFLNAQKSTIAAWDVTVKDSAGNEKKGRMYAPYIAMIMGTNSTTNSSATSTSNAEKVLNNDFYVLTKDGYVYQTSMNGIDPNGFVFWSNNRGFIDKTNDKTLYHSIMDPTTPDTLENILGNIAPQLPTTADTETNITHKVFINNPNKDLPANLSPVAIAPAIPENFSFKGSSNVDLKTNVSTGGIFTFIADKACSYRLTINTDGNSGYNLSTDTVIENVCRAGVNTINWDGKDKNGNKLPVGTYTAQLIMKGGEYHFPVLDAEYNPFGIKVKLINAPGYSDPEAYTDKYKVYYDESNYTSANGTSVNLDASNTAYHISQVGGLSGIDSSQGTHGYFNNYGNGKGIDTWTYFPGAPVTLNFEVTPVSANIAKSGVEDTVISFTNNDFISKFTDGANNTLNRIKVVDLPANGTLKLYGTPVTVGQEIIILNLSGLTFTPNKDWNGNTSFNWNGSNGTVYSANNASVNITVTPVNDAPVASNDTAATNENTPINLSVLNNDSDVDKDTLTITSVTTPTHGTAVVNEDGTIKYTPNTNYKGEDSFSYTISDGHGSTATATVNIYVNAVNDAPNVENISKNGLEDIDVNFTLDDFISKFSDIDEDALTKIRIESLPSNGVLKLNGVKVKLGDEILVLDLSKLTFTPNSNWNGSTSFKWNGNDGTVYSNESGTVNITVTPVNDVPVASNDIAIVSEDGTAKINVLNNDSDVDGDQLTIVSVTKPAHGTAVINEDGTVSYTPDTNYNGNDSFSYTVSDGHGGTNTATVSITVNAVNDAPVATNDVATVSEDGTVKVSVLKNDSDVDRDILTITSVTKPAHGTAVINEDGTVSYTPDANYNGTDSFDYTINDGNGGIATATVNIDVNAVNDTPVLVSDITTVSEDGTVKVDVLANDSDVDGDLLTIISVTKPEHGTALVNEDGTISYTPDANYNGTDSFIYTVSDGHGGTNTATVSVTVNEVNDAPTVDNITKSGPEDADINFSNGDFSSKFSDVDGNSLVRIRIESLPSDGILKLNGVNVKVGDEISAADLSKLTFTPNSNWNGSTSFKWDGNDGTVYAIESGTVNISITPVNDAPVASSDIATVLEDGSVKVNVLSNDGDVDGDQLTIISVTKPAHGTAVINEDGTINYTPDANYNGSDSFSYTVSDGHGGTNTATVSITVKAVNDAPALANDITTVSEDGTVKVDVLANDSDVDGDSLTIISVTKPEHGTAVINEDGTISYTPDANYNGADSFSYTVSDGHGGTNTATVNVTVKAVNDAPTVGNILKSGLEDTDINFNFQDFSSKFSDIDGNSLVKIKIESLPINGVLKLNGVNVKLGDEILVLDLSKLTFTPNSNWNGSTSFKWNGNDGTVYSTENSTVNINITPVNDAPVASNDTATVSEDRTVKVSVLNNDSDIDRDTLTITLVTKPAHGVAVINNDGTISYTPDANYNGNDSFSYTISDGHGGTSTAAVNVTVNAVNDAPVASNDTATVSEDGTVKVSVLNNDSDIDKDTLTITSVTKPAHGVAVINNDGTISYTPDANYNGNDSFSYTISDGHGGTSTAAVNVTVNAVNDAPVASNDTATVSEDGTVKVSVLNNDSDIDRDTLTITSVTKPAHGVAVINNDGTISYTPDANYNGNDSFSYTISDGHGGTSTATVSVTVNAVNDAPVAPDYSRITPYNRSVTGRVVGNDIDGDGLEYSLKTSPTKGYVEVDKSGVWTYVPNINYVGTDRFTVEVSDGHGGKTVSTINITVRDRADLVGTVVNRTTGKVVANTTIQLSDQSGHVIYTTTTDSNGNYTINNVKLGIYGFKVSNPSHETQNIEFDIEPTSETNYTVRKDFQIYEAIGYSLNLTSNPTTILGDGKATSVLSAKVVDKNNNPIANVEVNFSAAEGSFPNGTVAITDKNGIATILFKSSKVDGTKNRNIPVIATVNDKVHNLQVSDQIVMVFEPGIISGLVVDNETGRPVSNAVVEVSKDFDGDGIDDFYSKMITGADGKYAIAIPKGNVQYKINITKPVKVGNSYVNVKFTQNNQTGNITGAGNENYSSVNTAAGVVLIKQPNGNVSLLSDSSVFSIEVLNKSGSSSLDKGKISLNNGVFEAEGLEKGQVYTVAINYTFPSGEKIVVGSVNVTVDSDGQLNLSSALIDPYGTITDALTKNNIDGAKVQLYYADTARNRAAGRTPNTLVNLPRVPGFAPADNINPQIDDVNGKYAFMVFPDADYYLVVTKDGYDTFTSETISVGKEIVKRDIQMNQQKKQPVKPNSEPTKIVAELPKTGSPIGTEAISLIGFIALVSGIGVLTAAKKKN